MINSNSDVKIANEKILNEYVRVANRIASLRGLRRIINNLSIRTSLFMTTFLQRCGYNKKIKKYNQRKRILNIGCGYVFDKAYTNTDLFPTFGQLWKIILRKQKIKYQCLLNLTFEDKNLFDCADHIVCSHVIEHLPPTEVIPSLKNCFNYLKEGGSIRLSTPYISLYNADPIPSNQDVLTPILAINSLVYGWNHRFMFDTNLMKILMEEAGFTEVKEVAFQEGFLGSTDLVNRKEESIYIEGLKKAK